VKALIDILVYHLKYSKKHAVIVQKKEHPKMSLIKL